VDKLPDIDIMLLADDELDEAAAAALEAKVAGDPAARTKLAALRELTESVRGHLELAADEEDRLEGLWASVERRLDVDAARVKEPQTVAARAAIAAAAVTAQPRGLWARFARWIDEHRGHVLTGALSAGAVAALTLMLRPGGERVVERVVQGPPVVATPAMAKSTPPDVESIDVAEGSTQVWTLANDGEGEAAVIWITPADTVEGL
jgi:anti-sigma factor RsiW